MRGGHEQHIPLPGLMARWICDPCRLWYHGTGTDGEDIPDHWEIDLPCPKCGERMRQMKEAEQTRYRQYEALADGERE